MTENMRSEQIREVACRCRYENLRPGQEVVIRAVLARHDALAVLPTGSGPILMPVTASRRPGSLAPATSTASRCRHGLQCPRHHVEPLCKMQQQGARR
jgi:hypothetical protein